MQSLWEESSCHRGFGRLDGDLKTDILIIGGGMAGLLCAYMLQKKGADYLLAEAKTVCGGVTKNTTAKITSQHGLIYDKMISRFGVEKAMQYLCANEAALQGLCELSRNIDCDFEQKDAYVYSLNSLTKLENEVAALKKLGFNAELCKSVPIPIKVAGAVRFRKEAQFNPLKFASEISMGLNIYEHTAVRELKGLTAITDFGKITANRIIIATHFPFLNKHGAYFLKMYQHRSYVIALENAPQVNGMYVDEAQKGMSFRNYNNLLLIGGGDHRTGKQGENWHELRTFAARCYPEAKEKYHWATQDCMTLDSIPYIGEYSKSTPGLYVATGFNKWGMTSSMVSAMILSDILSGRNNPYAEVFSPDRTIIRPQLALNAFEATLGLITPTARRCPHLGCALRWNSAEHSWDCSCHGSRFTREGNLIDNPATGDLKKKQKK